MHPPEPAYPCYLPVLGEFNRMTPHEGPSAILPDDWVCLELAGFGPSSSAGHAHFSRSGLGYVGLCPAFVPAAGHVPCRGVGQRAACPLFAGGDGGAGEVGGAGGLCPAFVPAAGHVLWRGWESVGHTHFWRSGLGYVGLCPAFACRTGHVPRESPMPGRGGPNWAKLESSGILVSAFDSEATGEFA
jgi:hypothetical protein